MAVSAESQWPEHLVPLKEVDNLLRCGICFEYFNIAMIIPQCSHNYCSLCIRRSLSYKPQCPTCCVAATGPDLKNNRILDELVQTFNSARQQLFQSVLDFPPVSPTTVLTKKASVKEHVLTAPASFALKQEKQYKDIIFVKDVCKPKRHMKLPETESKKIKLKHEESLCSEEDYEMESNEVAGTSPVGGTKNPEVPSTSATKVITKVECPICGIPVQELHINKHLDMCLTRGEKKESLRSASGWQDSLQLAGMLLPLAGMSNRAVPYNHGELAQQYSAFHILPWKQFLKNLSAVHDTLHSLASQDSYETKNEGELLVLEEKEEYKWNMYIKSLFILVQHIASSGRKLLPKVVYNLLSDRDLRRRLKEYGLSTQGTRQQLIKRHKEFVHMYNSQCDSLNPKSVVEIVKELENIEKTQAQLESSKPKEDSMTFTKHQTENEIDEIHRDYRKKHKVEFQHLIDQMNKRKKNVSKIKMDPKEPLQKNASSEELPLDTGKTQSVEQIDQASISNCLPESEPPVCGKSQSVDWPEVRGLGPTCSFQSSESSNSSSSDIIRDLEIAGMCSGSSDNNRFPAIKMTKQKSQRSGRSQLLSKSKRRKR